MNKLFSKKISLERDSHIYKLQDYDNLEFTSVTTFIGHFFEEFDAKKIATKLVKSNMKYMHMSVEELMAQWKHSADYGTVVHEELENYIIHGTQIKEKKSIQGINWLKKYMVKSKYDVFSECIVYSKELKIAGTIDLLLYDKNADSYAIMDWKTSKRIDSKAFKNRKGNHSVTSNMDDCNFNHYSLQTSLYRYILEKFYGLKISEHMIVHLMDDGCVGYHTPYLKNYVLAMLNELGDK
tara:strand:+ start:215 stop:928 length:714 start_codon:yes stop_codon:yes gene_type:complete